MCTTKKFRTEIVKDKYSAEGQIMLKTNILLQDKYSAAGQIMLRTNILLKDK